jgi:rubrerythrin
MQKALTERQERLLALFKVAIEREQESQKLYADMAETCEDDDLRQVIETLRNSERMHEDVLLERYKFIRADTQFKD